MFKTAGTVNKLSHLPASIWGCSHISRPRRESMQVINFYYISRVQTKKQSSNIFLESSQRYQSTNILIYRWPCETEAQGGFSEKSLEVRLARRKLWMHLPCFNTMLMMLLFQTSLHNFSQPPNCPSPSILPVFCTFSWQYLQVTWICNSYASLPISHREEKEFDPCSAFPLALVDKNKNSWLPRAAELGKGTQGV